MGWKALESIGIDWNLDPEVWNRLVESAWPGIILSLLLILSKNLFAPAATTAPTPEPRRQTSSPSTGLSPRSALHTPHFFVMLPPLNHTSLKSE